MFLNFKRQTLLNRYILAVVILIFIFLFDFLGFLQMTAGRLLVANWQSLIFSRVQKITQPLNKLEDFWQLRAKLEDLEYRYREATVHLGELEALRQENEALRQLLENSDRTLEKIVIAKPVTSFAKPVVMVGENSDLHPGSVVLGEGILLGTIKSLNYGQAEVLLLNNMLDQGIVAKTETGVKGLVKGNGQEILLMEVESEAELLANQRVLTAGQEGIEADILIGQISQLKEQDPARASQTAVIKQAVDFYELSLVELLP